MRVIDLLNKIANGEEIPSPIYHNNLYYDFEDGDYFNQKTRNWLFNDSDIDTILNDEVEIIEEDKKKEEDKGIEGLWITSSGLHSGEMSNGYEEENLKDIVKHNFNVIHNKINEIIVVLNEMREDK